MTNKIWNGPVSTSQFFGDKQITEAEYYKEIFGVPADSMHWSNNGINEAITTEQGIASHAADALVYATKYDGGKTDWSLLPWDAVEEIIKVLQFGAGKYSPWNWAENGGFKFNRLFNSSMRHFVAWFWRREDLDPETGLSHMAHLGCNVLFLLHYVLNGNKFKTNDNRPDVS